MSRTLITQHLSTQNTPDPSNPTAIPTSLSLSIPFFSRSSSSSQTYSTDLDTSSSSYSDISPGLGIGINPNYLYNPQASSLDLRKSTSSSSSRSSIRPGLKKMPSWNNQTWSPRTSQDVYIRRASEQSESSSPTDGEFVFDSGASGHGRRKSLINIDFGTWSKKRKIIFSGKRKSLSISKLKLKSTLTTTNSNPSSVEKSIPFKDESVAVKTTRTDQGMQDIIFSPLQRVWARTDEHEHEDLVDRTERHRRGSDWPPTHSRAMYLDLSGIPTFTGEYDQSEGSDLLQRFSKFSFGNTKNQDQINQIPSVVQLDVEDRRVDTPLEMPVRPRLNLRLRKSHSSSILSPVLDTEEEEEEVRYTSGSGRSDNKLEKEQFNDNRKDSQAGVKKEAQGQEQQQEQEEEYFTPCFIPSSSFISLKTTYPTRSNNTVQTSKGSVEVSPIFDLSIFSPRPGLPNAPVLKGIIDTLPISPLELPSSSSINSFGSFRDIALSFPTPVLSKDPPSSPIVMPIPRKGVSVPNQSIESVLNPYPCSTIYRRSSLTDRRPSRPSTTIEGIPTTRRRMSLILKPAILPCPTPPSLLTSPKTLGSEYIPPLFSPSSTSPTSSLFVNTTIGIGGLPNRRGRGSLKLKLPPSHFANSTGLGSGPEKDEQEEEKEVHVPTPGTFGLEGEKERFGNEGINGINPYFA
ncbi:hypothetical protein V865_004956 [Kwoniella europaea PYCC6329]|uniref:Uncharacterized protein n=1 Tax=Kwoniella europaea PYCC6329 TaxID=1423913 RepID=A0AAX4KL47_9TREE